MNLFDCMFTFTITSTNPTEETTAVVNIEITLNYSTPYMWGIDASEWNGLRNTVALHTSSSFSKYKEVLVGTQRFGFTATRIVETRCRCSGSHTQIWTLIFPVFSAHKCIDLSSIDCVLRFLWTSCCC